MNQHYRLWPNIKPTLAQRLAFAGCAENTRPNIESTLGQQYFDRPLRGRGFMYLLYSKNPTLRWLRAIPTPRSGNVHNFLVTLRPVSWACGHGKLFLTWLFPDIFQYDSPKKWPTILYAVNLWLKPVSGTGSRFWSDVVSTLIVRH